MDIFEKYGIQIINGKRYYEYNVDEKLPLLDNTIPYFFKYKDIEIYESAWGRLTLKILDELDKRNPKSEDYLLSLKYDWSKTDVFSETKKTNYSPFKNLYVNVNHTSTHSLMSIQRLLRAYDVDPSECYLLIVCHPASEPEEVRNYFIDKEKRGFSKFLAAKQYNTSKINVILNSFEIINKILKKISPSFDNFYLFDDYNYFISYKQRVIEKSEQIYFGNSKNIKLVTRYLDYYEEYIKNRKFYEEYDFEKIPPKFIEQAKAEIEHLFSSMNTDVITSSKIYSRLKLICPEQIKSVTFLNTENDIFEFLKLNFNKTYYFQEPYISKTPITGITADEIITNYAYSLNEFNAQILNEYADKMHIKRISNYLLFIKNCSNDYVLTEQGVMKKKSLLEIEDSYLTKLSDNLAFYINSFGPIDSRVYKGYLSLPTPISYKKMNKDFLFGIVLSYLSAKFDTEILSNKYTDFQYIIKLKKQ